MNKNKTFFSVVFYDLRTVLFAFPFSIIPLMLIAVLRKFNSAQFLFLSLILIYLVILIFFYITTYFFSKNYRANRILAITSISFVLVSFLVLNIDRSRSFYLLKWVAEKDNGITLSQIQLDHNLTPLDTKAVSQRLLEQLQSSTITKINGEYRATFLGKFIYKLSFFIAKFLNLRGFIDA